MTEEDFLDTEALAVLTGYRRPGKQVEHLIAKLGVDFLSTEFFLKAIRARGESK